MAIDKHLKARAKQLAQMSAAPMTEDEALGQAIRERFGNDPEALIGVAVRAASGWANEIRKNGFNADTSGDENEQATLPLGDCFERLPHVLGIRTEEGTLLFTKNSGTDAMVRQYQKEGLRHHKSGVRFFTEFGKQLQCVGFDPERNFAEQLHELESGDESAEGAA